MKGALECRALAGRLNGIAVPSQVDALTVPSVLQPEISHVAQLITDPLTFGIELLYIHLDYPSLKYGFWICLHSFPYVI